MKNARSARSHKTCKDSIRGTVIGPRLAISHNICIMDAKKQKKKRGHKKTNLLMACACALSNPALPPLLSSVKHFSCLFCNIKNTNSGYDYDGMMEDQAESFYVFRCACFPEVCFPCSALCFCYSVFSLVCFPLDMYPCSSLPPSLNTCKG